MRRLLLIGGMIASLWPAGVIAVSAATGSSSSQNTSIDGTAVTPPASAPGSETTATTPDPVRSTISEIVDYSKRQDSLIAELNNAENNQLVHGSDPPLSRKAANLAMDFRSASTALDVEQQEPTLASYANAAATLDRDIADFARAPSRAAQRRMDRDGPVFNRELDAVKRVFHSGQ